MMNKKAVEKLEEYLGSECSDYGLSYSWEWVEDYNCFEVTIKKEHDFRNLEITIHFMYNNNEDMLEIELGENNWYKTEWFESSVKYFWMLISPKLFV